MDIYSKRCTFLVKSSIALLFSSLFVLPLKANIIFDFHGNHVLHGKAQAELHLKDSYIFGSKITPDNLVVLKFSSSVGRFTIHPKEIQTIFAGLDATGKLTQFNQFYVNATGNKTLGVKKDGKWKFDYDVIEGSYGKWSLRKKSFQSVCFKEGNFQKAVTRDDLPYVKQCLKFGFPVNRKTNQGWTGLHVGLLHGKLNIVKYLLKHGAKKSIKDKRGRTPHDYAIQAESEWSHGSG